MKKKILASILGLAFILSGSAAFAEDAQGFEPQGQQQGGPGGGMGGRMNPMMQMMNRPSMLATSDGGVVVMEGPRLIKYDANLTLVKEVELPRGKKPQPDQAEGQQAPQQ